MISNIRYTAIDGDNPQRMDIKLYNAFSSDQVYWSVQCSSYVVNDNPRGFWTGPDGTPCDLVSINGHGEIRWIVSSQDGNTSGDTDAARYFGLTWNGYRG